jgi:hypothetical protein
MLDKNGVLDTMRGLMSIAKSLRLHLVDGTADGLQIAEIVNWTGHIVAAPRSGMTALLGRPEVSRTGVYILLGADLENEGSSLAYIGEGDDVGRRLAQHMRTKDFWDRVVVLTSKDANLTKAHARYLESRLIALAKHAKRVRLANETSPVLLPLPESDISDIEYFIEQVKLILPRVGFDILRPATNAVGEEVGTADLTPVLPPVSDMGGNENSAATGKDPGYAVGDLDLVSRRLLRHSFREAVLDAYRGTCAITGTRIRPLLQAAHIRPVTFGGENRLENALLLRADVHVLFDNGYLAVGPAYSLQVSPCLRDEFGGGEEYYAKAGQIIGLPEKGIDYPARDYLEWHLHEVFRAS